MIDHSNALRGAVIKVGRANAPLAAIIMARLYDEVPDQPTWPFAYYALVNVLPFGNSCGEGSRISFNIHTFAKGPGTDGIAKLNAAVIAALTDPDLDIAGTLWNFDCTGARFIQDSAEVSSYHGIVSFTADIV